MRRALRRCERVLADLPTVEHLHQEGITQARAANLFGLEQDFLDQPAPVLDAPRDIDVLFVGNWHAAAQRHRLPWLGHLARLRSRWNVVLATGAHGVAVAIVQGEEEAVLQGQPFRDGGACGSAGSWSGHGCTVRNGWITGLTGGDFGPVTDPLLISVPDTCSRSIAFGAWHRCSPRRRNATAVPLSIQLGVSLESAQLLSGLRIPYPDR